MRRLTNHPESARTGIALCLCLGLIAPTWAQTLWGPTQVGMSEQSLRQTLNGVLKVDRSERLGTGLRSRWHLPATRFADALFDTVFYFSNDGLQEVTQSLGTQGGNCPLPAIFARVQAQLRNSFGSETTATDPLPGGGQRLQAFWTTAQGVAVAANLSQDASRCTLRISYKPQTGKDAGEL